MCTRVPRTAAVERRLINHSVMAASLAEADDHNNRTTIASLPKEVLAIVVEYASVDDGDDSDTEDERDDDGANVSFESKLSWLGGLLRIGCVNRSFLEALKCVGTLRIEVLQRRRRGRFDDCVQRWCGIASRRLSGVLHISTVIEQLSQGTRRGFLNVRHITMSPISCGVE